MDSRSLLCVFTFSCWNLLQMQSVAHNRYHQCLSRRRKDWQVRSVSNMLVEPYNVYWPVAVVTKHFSVATYRSSEWKLDGGGESLWYKARASFQVAGLFSLQHGGTNFMPSLYLCNWNMIPAGSFCPLIFFAILKRFYWNNFEKKKKRLISGRLCSHFKCASPFGSRYLMSALFEKLCQQIVQARCYPCSKS